MWDAADLATLVDADLPGYALGTKADLSQIGGLFRKPYGETFGLVSGSNPTFLCLIATAPGLGTSLTVNGTAYTVQGVKPDGQGMVTLELEQS